MMKYLHDNLPHLSKVSDYVERTNYYSAKGIVQIELKTYRYVKYGVVMERYYVVLRCNPSIIMGDSKVLLVDLKKYSPADILDRLLKRIYEINEFRYIRLDKQPLSLFLTNRADIAEDIHVDFPQLVVWLCNMSFPYGYRNMKRTKIDEKMDALLLQKQSLKDKLQDQQDINKRLTEFQNVISKHEILQKFDRHVFESIIDRVIVGEKAENGEINPYKLKFIFKTGYEKDEVASSQPFSFANSCSNGNNDCDIISLQGDNDTRGDGSLDDKGEP